MGHVRNSPQNLGRLDLIVIRPAEDVREVLDHAHVDADSGLVGDTWHSRPSARSSDGGPDREAQVTVMNIRFAQLIAGSQEAMPLAGDQLYVDLDLSNSNLPTDSLLRIGSAVLRVTEAPHTGCIKFKKRFGKAAFDKTFTDEGQQLRLRGINTTVVQSGRISVADVIHVERPIAEKGTNAPRFS